MEELTMIFMGATMVVYLVSILYNRKGVELTLLTLILGACSICTILTDESINGDMIGLLTLFPVLFAVLQSVIKLIWGR